MENHHLFSVFGENISFIFELTEREHINECARFYRTYLIILFKKNKKKKKRRMKTQPYSKMKIINPLNSAPDTIATVNAKCAQIW